MTDRDYYLERMSGPELEIFAAQGGTLPRRLATRLQQWRADQMSRDRFGFIARELPEISLPPISASPCLRVPASSSRQEVAA